MSAVATISRMSKESDSKNSVPIAIRLSESEAAELDEAADAQAIPVKRATLVTHIVREWLRERRDGKGRKR